MLDVYAFEDSVKLEREALNRQQERRARWLERMPRTTTVSAVGGVRRRLARALLSLADRLDPRGVVSVPHLPARAALNGTLHRV